MKKVLLTAAIAVAFVFGMTACNSNKNAEPEQECTEQTEKVCEHECHHPECTCADSACAENHCEGCTDTTCACKMHKCCKGEKPACNCGEECANANCEGCTNEQCTVPPCCKGKKECCKKECCKDGEKKCCKDGEKKECCKDKK